MSNLPGNPDYDNAKLALASTVLSADDDAATIQSILIDHASATLALAYEQRTANLIAVATAVGGDGIYQLDPALIGAAQQEIAKRLGMGQGHE